MTNTLAITQALDAIEAEERAVVLLAVESGSRAWGFASPDSDWDVRFLYACPTDWHLMVHPGRDVIERMLPGDLDVSGWDLRKTLHLLLRGNCAVREWLASPVVYRAQPEWVAELRTLATRVPAGRAALHHYSALVRRPQEALGKRPVNLKRYLYAVRPALALRWMRLHGAGTPPMSLPELVAAVPMTRDETEALAELLALKAQTSELGSGDPRPALDALVAGELADAEDALRGMGNEPVPPDVLRDADALLARGARFADAVLDARGGQRQTP